MKELSRNQALKFDKKAIEGYGISKKDLMLNAGTNFAKKLSRDLGADQKILFCVGKGDNGSDGLIAAKKLLKNDYDVYIYLLEEGKLNEFKKNFETGSLEKRCRDLEDDFDVYVDCLIGFNLRGKPRKKLEKTLNELSNFEGRMISLDVPSGLDTSTGKLYDAYFPADKIYTLGFYKKGLKENFDDPSLELVDINYPDQLYTEFGLLSTLSRL